MACVRAIQPRFPRSPARAASRATQLWRVADKHQTIDRPTPSDLPGAPREAREHREESARIRKIRVFPADPREDAEKRKGRRPGRWKNPNRWEGSDFRLGAAGSPGGLNRVEGQMVFAP
jgi:hypothetical protein